MTKEASRGEGGLSVSNPIVVTKDQSDIYHNIENISSSGEESYIEDAYNPFSLRVVEVGPPNS